MDPPPLAIISTIVVVPFFAIGVLGNIGVIFCILFTPSLRTRANAIIVSLAVSCLVFLVTVVPFTLDSFLHSSWRYADWYCHTTAHLSFCFIGITVYNIAVLSVYRYVCVVHPAKLFLRSIPNLVVMLVFSWLFPVVIQTCLAVFQIAHTEYVSEYARCVLKKSGGLAALYNLLVLGGFLPTLSVTLYSYAKIYHTVRKSRNRLRNQQQAGEIMATSKTSTNPIQNNRDQADRGEAPNQEDRKLEADRPRSNSSDPANHRDDPDTKSPTDHRTRAKHKTTKRPLSRQNNLTKISVVVFALFMICYGPIITLTVIYSKDDFPADAYTICTVIYWLGSCLHPLVYATLQPQMRRAFLRLARCCCKAKRRIPAASSVGDIRSTNTTLQ